MQTLYRTVGLKSTQIYVNTEFTYCVHAYKRARKLIVSELARD